MIKLQIPDVGDKLTLAADWKFNLYYESRNSDLLLIFTGEKFNWGKDRKPVEIILPVKTVLVVDRVYIRKGLKDFSSLSFRIDSSPDRRLNKKRFWAKLSDVNEMKILDIQVQQFIPPLHFYPRHKVNYCYYDHSYPKHKFTGKTIVVEEPICSRNANDEDMNKNVFKVKMTLHLEDTGDQWGNHKRIKQIDYVLKSLHGKELFTTTSLEALKKEAKKIFFVLYQAELAAQNEKT